MFQVLKSCRCSSNAFQTSSRYPHWTLPPCLILVLFDRLKSFGSCAFLEVSKQHKRRLKKKSKKIQRRSKCTLCTYTTSKVYSQPDNSKIHGHLLLKYWTFRQHHLAQRWKMEWRDDKAKCEMCSGNRTLNIRIVTKPECTEGEACLHLQQAETEIWKHSSFHKGRKGSHISE